jgi:hypothetical protein
MDLRKGCSLGCRAVWGRRPPTAAARPRRGVLRTLPGCSGVCSWHAVLANRGANVYASRISQQTRRRWHVAAIMFDACTHEQQGLVHCGRCLATAQHPCRLRWMQPQATEPGRWTRTSAAGLRALVAPHPCAPTRHAGRLFKVNFEEGGHSAGGPLRGARLAREMLLPHTAMVFRAFSCWVVAVSYIGVAGSVTFLTGNAAGVWRYYEQGGVLAAWQPATADHATQQGSSRFGRQHPLQACLLSARTGICLPPSGTWLRAAGVTMSTRRPVHRLRLVVGQVAAGGEASEAGQVMKPQEQGNSSGVGDSHQRYHVRLDGCQICCLRTACVQH